MALLDESVISKMDPLVAHPDELYSFSLGKKTRLKVFDIRVPSDTRGWSCQVLIMTRQGNRWVPIALSRGSVLPADNRSVGQYLRAVEDNLSQQALDDLADRLYHLDLAVRRAHQRGSQERLEVHNGHESLDFEQWPIDTDREIVAGFAVEGGYTHLFGDAGVGKSMLAHNIGLHAASGWPYLGFAALRKPVVVLYLSLEMHTDEFRERHNKLLKHFPAEALDNFLFACPDEFDFGGSEVRKWLADTIEDNGARLVIVDSHSDWRGENDLNDNNSIGRNIVLPMLKLVKNAKVGLVLLDHTGWVGKRPSGAKVVWNKASIGIHMETDPHEEYRSAIKFTKWRNAARPKPRPIRMAYDSKTYLVEGVKVHELLDFTDELSLPADTADVTQQIMRITGLKDRQARERKKTMLDMGYLVRQGRTIRLPEDSESQSA